MKKNQLQINDTKHKWLYLWKRNEHASGNSTECICSGQKEQGHLFVPSCGAKSLTEAILNDIGESLQSEELQGVTGRREKRRVNRDEEISVKGKKKDSGRTLPGAVEQQRICQVMHHARPLGIHRRVVVLGRLLRCSSLWSCTRGIRGCLCLRLPRSVTTWLTVPGMCVLAVLWPLGPVVVILLIFFFLRSSSRCSFCLFCTSISSEMKLFFTCFIFQQFVLEDVTVYILCSCAMLPFLHPPKIHRDMSHDIKAVLLAIHWPFSLAYRMLWALTIQQMHKWSSSPQLSFWTSYTTVHSKYIGYNRRSAYCWCKSRQWEAPYLLLILQFIPQSQSLD